MTTAIRLWTPPAEPTCDRGIDWIAVERVVYGHPIDTATLTHRERIEAVTIMQRLGVKKADMIERLDSNGYAVDDLLAAAGLLPPERMCTIDGCWRARTGHGMCKRHHVQERNEVRRSEITKLIRHLHGRGRTVAEIAATVRRGQRYVQQILAELEQWEVAA